MQPATNLIAIASRGRGPHPAARLGVLAILTLTGACSAYLHNPERATATADMKTKFGQLSAPAYFDAQEKNLTDFAAREDKAVAEFLVSSRDYRILNVIERAPDANPNLTDADRLSRFIAEDLTTATGQQQLSAAELQSFTARRNTSSLASATLNTNRRQIQRTAEEYRKFKGTLPTGCDAVLANPTPSHPSGQADQAREYGQLVSACVRLKKRETLLDGCKPAPAGGALKAACVRLAALANDTSNAQRKAELEAAEKALVEAMKAKADPNAAAQAQAFLDSVQELPTDERLTAVLTQLDRIFGSELQSTLDEMTSTGNTVLAQYSDPIMKALQLFDAIGMVAEAEQSRAADKSSALLIGLAKVRHDLKILGIDIAARAAEAALLRDQIAALHSQIEFLGRAQASLGQGSLDEALNLFLYSVNNGHVPFRVAEFREIQLQRATALKHARATEADYRVLLQPAIDQLAAYGAGGIKPEAIADLLSALPMGIPLLED